jgi:hypothetical protein
MWRPTVVTLFAGFLLSHLCSHVVRWISHPLPHDRNLSSAPILASSKPHRTFVLCVFSGDDKQSLATRDALRHFYRAYGGQVNLGKDLHWGEKQSSMASIEVIYIVSHPGASEDGDLIGDVLYVNVPRGYRNIVHKTKAMLSVVRHFDFNFLLKADDDTVVCFNKLAKHLLALPSEEQKIIYAGVPTGCGLDSNPQVGRVIKDPTHRWYDSEFVEHTMGSMECYPVYHQGAFYVLSYDLVDFLYSARDRLVTFTNEDVTVGTWLFGVNRKIITLNSLQQARLWDCTCAKQARRWRQDQNSFFHNCKELAQIHRCAQSSEGC